MKFAESWLREWVNPSVGTSELVEQITMAGLEVDAVDFLGEDTVIELDLTPNRGDCLSIQGLAREAAVLNKQTITPPTFATVAPVIDDAVPVALKAGDKCARYAGRVIRDIDGGAQSPDWLVKKLEACGVQSINPVVDVTNYVMLELGQPMHAFDLDRLDLSASGAAKGIQVRLANAGEPLELLDGNEVKLSDDTLVIADQSKAIAMAGIMGGEETSVTESTRHIFFESAWFNPLAIAGQPRKYGLHTDSSHRFERGVDAELSVVAIERATELLLAITGGQPGPVSCESQMEHLPQPAIITLNQERLAQQLGVKLDAAEVEGIILGLGLILVDKNDEGWQFQTPSWRFDLSIDADLVEEVARVYGYNRLPVTTMAAPLAIEQDNETALSIADLREPLLGLGYQEAVTYSFVDPELQQLISPDVPPVRLANPISSDMSVMRTSLWPGLLAALKHNLNRQQPRVRLFETGLRFLGREGAGSDTADQEQMIAGLITGSRYIENWANDTAAVDFYDIKAHVETLLALTGNSESFSFSAPETVAQNAAFSSGQPSALHSALHPGQSAALTLGNEIIGWLGRLHPSIQQALDIEKPVFLFELRVRPIASSRLANFADISRFPAVRRDIAVIVDQKVTARALADTVCQNAGSYLLDLKIFDVYQGKGIENNRKSVGLGLTFQASSRTLDDQEIQAAVTAVIKSLESEHAASLRG